MAINPSIPLQVQPIQLPDPAAAYQKAITLKALLGQQEMQGLQTQQLKRAIDRQNQIESLSQQSGGNLATLKDLLYRNGFYNEAAGIDKTITEQMKAGNEAKTSAANLTKAQWALSGQLAGAILNANPQDRQQVYSAVRAEAQRNQLPNSDKLPEQWNDQMIPAFQSMLARSMDAAKSQERVDTRQAYQTEPGKFVAPGPAEEPASLLSFLYGPQGGFDKQRANVGFADLASANGVNNIVKPYDQRGGLNYPQDVRQELGLTEPNYPDAVFTPSPRLQNVVANAPEQTPDNLRAEAQRLEALAGQTGNKVYAERAKDIYARAEKMDERIYKEAEDQRKLVEIYDPQSPSGTRLVPASEAKGMAGSAKIKAINVNVNAAGGNLDLGKQGSNQVDTELLNTTSRLLRLNRIQQSFKPDYLKLGQRFQNSWTALKERLGFGVDAGDRQQLEDFSKWKRTTIDNMNQYLKEQSGVAISPQEAERLKASMPDPGTKWYEGDSPTQFKGKMDDVISALKMAEARLVYIKRQGMSMKDVPLEQMPKIINDRGAQLEGIVKQQNPNASQQDVQRIVERQLAQEFGLVSD